MVYHVKFVLVSRLWIEDSIEGRFRVILERLVGLCNSLVLSFYFSSDLVDKFSSGYGWLRNILLVLLLV
jgi:hypothetical protein